MPSLGCNPTAAKKRQLRPFEVLRQGDEGIEEKIGAGRISVSSLPTHAIPSKIGFFSGWIELDPNDGANIAFSGDWGGSSSGIRRRAIKLGSCDGSKKRVEEGVIALPQHEGDDVGVRGKGWRGTGGRGGSPI
jgi:hypothetical protein